VTRLQAYYGGDPDRWLDMPTGLLSAYVSALTSLVAQDCLRETQVIGVGTGTITKQDRNRILRDWSSDAAGPVEKVKPTPDERKALMSAVGIKHG